LKTRRRLIGRGAWPAARDAFFSRLMFAPHVSEFLSLYPDLSLDLIAKDQLGDLVGDGFDVAVRDASGFLADGQEAA
jgi:DNA-binding transcriptional LysR family regulator